MCAELEERKETSWDQCSDTEIARRAGVLDNFESNLFV